MFNKCYFSFLPSPPPQSPVVLAEKLEQIEDKVIETANTYIVFTIFEVLSKHFAPLDRNYYCVYCIDEVN